MDFEERKKLAMIEIAKDRLAYRTAQLDQRRKQFEDQYAMFHPDMNLWRLDNLEVRAFSIDIARWELEGCIASAEDQEEDDDKI